jgi:hypothetical protein
MSLNKCVSAIIFHLVKKPYAINVSEGVGFINGMASSYNCSHLHESSCTRSQPLQLWYANLYGKWIPVPSVTTTSFSVTFLSQYSSCSLPYRCSTALFGLLEPISCLPGRRENRSGLFFFAEGKNIPYPRPRNYREFTKITMLMIILFSHPNLQPVNFVWALKEDN